MTHNKLTIILAVSSLALSCDDPVSVAPDTRAPSFFGTVVDAAGTPVSGRNIYHTFHVASTSGEAARFKSVGSLVIPITVFVKVFVVISIRKLGRTDTLDTIVSDTLEPGNYSFVFNTDALGNGLYDLRIAFDGETRRSTVALQTLDLNRISGTEPSAVTDNEGKFTLSYDSLGVVRKFGNSYTIDSIDIIIPTPGWSSIVEGFRLDSSEVVQHTFVLDH